MLIVNYDDIEMICIKADCSFYSYTSLVILIGTKPWPVLIHRGASSLFIWELWIFYGYKVIWYWCCNWFCMISYWWLSKCVILSESPFSEETMKVVRYIVFPIVYIVFPVNYKARFNSFIFWPFFSIVSQITQVYGFYDECLRK